MNRRRPFGAPPPPVAARPRARAPQRRAAYEEFQATALFCPRCRVAQPVRERLLLVLADGDLFEYLCTQCGQSIGSRKGDSSIVPKG